MQASRSMVPVMSAAEDFTIEHFTDKTPEVEPRLGRFKLPVQQLHSAPVKKRSGPAVMQLAAAAPGLGE